MDVYGRIVDVTWCGGLQFVEDRKERTCEDERGAEVVEAVGVAER